MPMQPDTDPADYPPVKIDGQPVRYVVPTFFAARAPDGTITKLHSDNVRDWCKRPKHSIVGPWEPDTPAVIETDEPTEGPVEVPAAAPVSAEALDPLNKLREEAKELGIEFDQRWGKKRLSDAISAARGSQD